MRKFLLLITLLVCTSLSPNITKVNIKPVDTYEQEIKEIELIMLRSERNLDEVSLIIDNPKELKKVQKRFKKHNINLK